MKYHCKYPGKLTMKGYFQKKFEECKSSNRYSELLDNEIKDLLWYVLLKTHVTLSSSKEKLQQNMELLLKIGNVSREEYLAMSDDQEESSYSLGALFLITHNPNDAVDLIENNMKVTFRSDKQSQCEMFLREVTPHCIKEVVEVNQVRTTIKKVRFSEDVVSQSKDCPSNPTRTSQTSSGSMDYQYAYHKSINNGKRMNSETANNEDSNLEEKENVTLSKKKHKAIVA